MKCDKCGENIKKKASMFSAETGAEITLPNGKKLCYVCAKAAKVESKKSRRDKSKDPFVKVARSLRNLHTGKGVGEKIFGGRFLEASGQRVYTDGCVILAELLAKPDQYELVDLDSLSKLDDLEYPDIGKLLLEGMPDSPEVQIPEELFRYLKPFSDPKPVSGTLRIQFRDDRIMIRDSRWDMVLNYREFACPGLKPVDYDYGYIMALRPSRMRTDPNDAGWVLGSYIPVVDACKAVLVMPMKQDD